MAALIATCAVGLITLLVLAATRQERRAFSLGVSSGAPAVTLRPGQSVCQAPVSSPDRAAAFDRVDVVLGTFYRLGPKIRVTVAPAAGGPLIGQGTLKAGYPDLEKAPNHSIPVGHIATTQPLRICLQDAGDRRVAVFGNTDAASRSSTAMLDGKPTGTDLNLVFERAHPRTALRQIGAMADRAALWRTSWMEGWMYVPLALIVFAGAPALVALALIRASAT